MSRFMTGFVLTLGLLQIPAMCSIKTRNGEIIDALNKAAASGEVSFKAVGDSLTMVNGIPNKNDNGCTVNVMRPGGTFITEANGLLLDADNKIPKRFYIDDCRPLPRTLLVPAAARL